MSSFLPFLDDKVPNDSEQVLRLGLSTGISDTEVGCETYRCDTFRGTIRSSTVLFTWWKEESFPSTNPGRRHTYQSSYGCWGIRKGGTEVWVPKCMYRHSVSDTGFFELILVTFMIGNVPWIPRGEVTLKGVGWRYWNQRGIQFFITTRFLFRLRRNSRF